VKPADAKLQRWIDLLAALLTHRFGVTLAELKTVVPAYGADKEDATINRMFERDKDELRALGIPIRVRNEESEDGLTQHYYIKAKDLYLPYLALASQSAGAVPPAGYREVPKLVFEPDELSTLIRAARCAKSVGDPALTRDAESAIAKLTYDLGVALGSVAGESERDAARVLDATSAPAVSTLGDALLRRKRVTFVYHSMNRDVTDERTVEPYGLFFSNGHWYLAGVDIALGELRKFRVSRMQGVSKNDKKPQTPDYEVPADFDLATHARSKEAWELGEEEPTEMIVEIRGDSGATTSLRTLGEAVAGSIDRRRFQVRRVDSFVRWIMSFGGDVVPISPVGLIDHYRTVLKTTADIYSEAAA
jgi:proteasome accessory factor B